MAKYLTISDIHPGRWGSHEKENRDALHAFAQHAAEQKAQLVLNAAGPFYTLHHKMSLH